MAETIYSGDARLNYVLDGNVYEAAKKRIRWLFEEFDGKVSVSTSGGKDSTVVLELAREVASELGVPTIKAHFLDQEAEYEATVTYMRYLMDREDVDLDWYQIPFRLFNATSHSEQWLHVWDETLSDEDWIRPKEPGSIHENPFFKGKGKRRQQIDRFKEVLTAINEKDGGAVITGMRAEESPTRRIFMVSNPIYKWVTWGSAGKAHTKGGLPPYYLFHPIYDWSYRDVWKSIYENDWKYNSFYDEMFKYGVPLRGMRVSSFHHETSMQALDFLQEIEPKTWERATRRLSGINTYAHVGEGISEWYLHGKAHLPYMFDRWTEYLDHLIDNLVESDADKAKYRRQQAATERSLPWIPRQEIAKTMCVQVIYNDLYGSNLAAWALTQKTADAQKWWENWKEEQGAKFDYEGELGRAV